jgi:hypothetical protein
MEKSNGNGKPMVRTLEFLLRISWVLVIPTLFWLWSAEVSARDKAIEKERCERVVEVKEINKKCEDNMFRVSQKFDALNKKIDDSTIKNYEQTQKIILMIAELQKTK